MSRMPASVIMIAFATGSVTIQSAKQPAELRAIMKVPPFEDGSTVPVEIWLNSISETKVKRETRSEVIDYILKNEEIHFYRKDVVFYSISEAVPPPKIETLPGPRIQ